MFGRGKSKSTRVQTIDDKAPKTMREVFGVPPIGLVVVPTYEPPAILGEIVEGEIVNVEPTREQARGLRSGKISGKARAARGRIARSIKVQKSSCTSGRLEVQLYDRQTFTDAYPGDPVRASAEWNNYIGNINGVSPYYCGE